MHHTISSTPSRQAARTKAGFDIMLIAVVMVPALGILERIVAQMVS